MLVSTFLTRLSAFLWIVVAVLCLTSLSARAEEPNESQRFERGEFEALYRENPNVSKEHLDFLPEGLKHHLRVRQDWQNSGIRAFSKKIGRWSYLVVVTDGLSTRLGSRAVLMQWRGGAGKTVDRLIWKPLNLPIFKYEPEGWSVVVSEQHFLLEWSDLHNAIQSTYCTGFAPSSCIRQTVAVEWSVQKLVLIEYYPASASGWTPIWKSGRWLVDPELQSFGID